MQIERITFMLALIAYIIAIALYFIYAVTKNKKFSTFGFYVTIVAFLIHSVCIISRAIVAGRLPLTNQYEFATAFAWGITLCFIIFVKKFNFDILGAFTLPVVFLVIGYASMQSKEINNLMPALQSRWLAFHVSMAIIGYGSFAIAFAVALLYLFGKEKDTDKLDLIIYRAVSLGFLFLTLCIITGAIWANKAWGSYWSWDPKETWSLITWIIYALFLHLRINKGLDQKKCAIFAVAGFLSVIFTYVGVNTLLVGLHSYK